MPILGPVARRARCVLVTGVAGYIGSHTALAFLDAGWSVIGVDNLSKGSRSAVPDGVEFIQQDCQSVALRDSLSGRQIDAAVHLAGLIDVAESVAEPAAYYAANFGTLSHFVETLLALGIDAVVFSSTAAVYGNADGRRVTESAPTAPQSPYGRSKLFAEFFLADVSAATALRHVALRYFNVAGCDELGRAGPRDGAHHLIKVVAEAAVGLREAVTIHGEDYPTPDGTGVRDYIHVSDLADAHVAAVEYLLAGEPSVTLNCGYGHGFSVREVVDRALAISGSAFRVQVGPRRPGDSASVIADNARLTSVLQWAPRRDDLDRILRSAIDWERRRAAFRSAIPAQVSAATPDHPEVPVSWPVSA